MKLLKLVCTAGLALAAETASAEATVGWVKQQGGLDNSMVQLYVSGMGDGLLWANAINQVRGVPRSYCPPAKLALNLQNYVQLLKSEMASNSKIADDSPLGLVFHLAFQRAFPCAD